MIVFPNKFSSLETERLILNEISMNDVDFLFEIRNNNDNNKFIGRKKSSLEEVKQFIVDRISDFKEKKGLIWMIYNRDTKQNIGSICFWNFNFETNIAEIGYELAPEFQSKGFIQEALSKVINFGFNELNLQTIEAFTDKNNKPSINALLKFNFVEETEFESNTEENLIMFKLISTQL
ncbi:ribosomal-protein-alanine N-acetyltransferase [Flavobacterium swingsii]|uniref:Ribosomal-protein-alanine N-acetyltransferase n=1 Tax=Flavobacterium swingsii TaxID=498292 RepID=A0A1I0ZTY0_9FLAO|nr:GNAT family N-acetyltransferase [Flavobacterium swingsii]SFB28782.1 ribosomal-protein-alanine N-acetyltransferase [Flavobacterium swingsii]